MLLKCVLCNAFTIFLLWNNILCPYYMQMYETASEHSRKERGCQKSINLSCWIYHVLIRCLRMTMAWRAKIRPIMHSCDSYTLNNKQIREISLRDYIDNMERKYRFWPNYLPWQALFSKCVHAQFYLTASYCLTN